MMAAKKECPFTAEELREMYEVQGLPAYAIGNNAGVTGITCTKWLRDAGLNMRSRQNVYKPFPSPSKDWLWEKYWKEGKSAEQIGTIWAKAVGRNKPFCAKYIYRLMEANGIDRRECGDGMKRYAKTERFRSKSAANGRKLQASGKAGKATLQHMQRIQKIATKLKIQQAKETRTCCLSGCLVAISRKRSRFCNVWFCCRSHQYEYIKMQTRQRRHDEMLDRMQQEADALMLKARNQARADLGLPPEGEEA